ncbi:hypothetical protein [Virgibacillus sediminis]|uniref:DUF2304 domain-containing protein n=1 Tax=Virgibacillus sediminis TaxID=202260 RepID=A0ABV7A210_9BACI
MESVPLSLWIIFCLFLLATLASAVYCIVRGRSLNLSYLTVVITLALPVISLLFAAQRPRDMTEWGYFWSQLVGGNILAVLILASLLYLGAWWLRLFEGEKYVVAWYRELRNRMGKKDETAKERRSRQGKTRDGT